MTSLQEQILGYGSDAIKPLLESLSHGVARKRSLGLLDKLLDDDSLPIFTEALRSSNPAVVSGVTTVLGESKRIDPHGLLELLEDSEFPTQTLEKVLLSQGKRLHARTLIERVRVAKETERPVILRLLERTDKKVIENEIVDLIDHEDWWVRLYMCRMLGDMKSEKGHHEMAVLLRDKSREVRLEAVRSLMQVEAKEELPELVPALRDPDLKVQTAVIDAVCKLGDASTVGLLLEVLKDESEYSRRAAVEVLNAIATTDAIQDLVRALRDEDWWVRVRAADALGTLGGKKVVEAVVGLLNDSDDFIRRYAVEILNTIPDEHAVEPLIAALRDGDWWVRERAIDALAATKDPRAVEPIIDVMQEDESVAAICARALATLNDPLAIHPLCGLLIASEDEVRREAEAALRVLSKLDLPEEDKSRLEAILARPDRMSMDQITRPFRVDPKNQRLGLEAQKFAAKRAKTKGLSSDSQVGPPSDGGSSDSVQSSPETVVQSGDSTGGSGGSGRAAVNFHKLEAGEILLDRYQILRKVGRGGFGSVYLVEDAAIQDELILKVLNPQMSEDETAVKRFVQELKLTRRITHRNVIRIHDFMDLGGVHAVSMEYFAGMDLAKVIKTGIRLSIGRALTIVSQICDGLGAAHEEQVIHRDIKPANVLVGKDDEVKIVDFGLASATQTTGSRLTASGLLIGTPEYMAPEQISGDTSDGRADIYSVGIILYELISGRQPFSAETPVKVLFQHLEGEATSLTDLVPGLDPRIDALVKKAMEKDPDDRFQNVLELRDTIEAILNDIPDGEEDEEDSAENRRVS
ncbi:MAG: protein kinase [Candidatus Eisenbacteria bacterium]|uniref:non-specific serine/threonine protein kinase n=1 Tax=Eiseniibacteriota bacterium TaxID=2212470 RepID=A0A7Y2E6V0_UNCEI|nr:protein kinase [Candidatus Eisenbacteria bacterium]